jgi:alpha-beta hydrolase superfamily lysophospholipase
VSRRLRPFALLGLLALAACGTSAAPPDTLVGNRPQLVFEPAGEPLASIVALHGYNDFKESFEAFGTAAAAARIRVVAYDQSGFGANPNRGYWPGDETLVQDLFDAVGAARDAVPDRPVYVLGESMGASVAMLALDRPEAPEVAGLILVAPGVWAGDVLNPWFRRGLGLVAAIVPDADLSGRRPRDIRPSDNQAAVEAMHAHPLYTPTTRAAALYGLVRLMDRGLEAAPHLTLPRLVLIGANDEVVPDRAYDAFLARIPPERCTLIRYPGGWHLLYRDHQGEVAIADTLAWILGTPPARGEACRPDQARTAQGR